MEWEDIESPEWYDKILFYPSEGIPASEDTIRDVVEKNGYGLSQEEIDIIIESLLTDDHDFEGPVTKKMVITMIDNYRLHRPLMKGDIEDEY